MLGGVDFLTPLMGSLIRGGQVSQDRRRRTRLVDPETLRVIEQQRLQQIVLTPTILESYCATTEFADNYLMSSYRRGRHHQPCRSGLDALSSARETDRSVATP